MLKKINREKLPTRFKIYDSNWNRGIVIGNTIIFNGSRRKEVKKINTFLKYDNNTHGYYIKYKDNEPKIYIIYLRK